MLVNFGAYKIRAHELDSKLSLQVTSEIGEVHRKNEDHRSKDFPNEICFHIEEPSKTIEAQGLKEFSFGPYKFVFGINYAGELFVFHDAILNVGKKLIDGHDTLTFAFLREPQS